MQTGIISTKGWGDVISDFVVRSQDLESRVHRVEGLAFRIEGMEGAGILGEGKG